MRNTSLSALWLVLIGLLSACTEDEPFERLSFPLEGNTVYVRLPAQPDRLNPCLATNTYARTVWEQLFLGLLHFNPQTLEMEPQLVVARPEIEERPDGQVAYTFELHHNAVWDDGRPITGQDYAFTLKAILNPNVKAAHIRPYLEFISGFEVDKDNPKRFTITTGETYIIGEAVLGGIPPMPAHFYDPNGWLEDISVQEMVSLSKRLSPENPNLKRFASAFNDQVYSRDSISGSGPYRLVEWETNQRLILSKKQDWWGGGMADDYPLLTAAPDTILFRIIPDQTAMMAALKGLQIDVVSQIDAKDFSDLQENEYALRYFNLHTPTSMSYYFIGINNQSPKLADKRVRRALAHLVNVDEYIETLFYGLAQRTIGPFHPSKPYYNDKIPPIAFSPEQAQQLLTDAGWEDTNANGIVDKQLNGELVELELDYMISSASKFSNRQALLLEADARKAGVKINIVPKDFSTLVADTKRRNYELYAGAWTQDPTVDDPKQLWHSDSDTPDGNNRVSFSHPEADSLIEEIRVTIDEERRNQLLLYFQRVIYEEQPYVFMLVPLDRIAISKRFSASPSSLRPGFFPNTFLKIED